MKNKQFSDDRIKYGDTSCQKSSMKILKSF